MQVQLTRPFRNGLLVRGAYTLGETMNMTDEDGTAGFDYNAPESFERNWAPAGFDRRHTFTMASTYRLPFGSDSGDTLANALIKDWQVNGTFAAYSGTPFSVTASNSALDQRGNLQTADLVGEVTRVGIGPDEPYYDPTAWANITTAATATPGGTSSTVPDSGTTTCRCSGRSRCSGRMRLQFRAEAFSVTNHPQWSNPNASVTSSNFMRITATNANLPGNRYVRFGLRLEF